MITGITVSPLSTRNAKNMGIDTGKIAQLFSRNARVNLVVVYIGKRTQPNYYSVTIGDNRARRINLYAEEAQASGADELVCFHLSGSIEQLNLNGVRKC